MGSPNGPDAASDAAGAPVPQQGDAVPDRLRSASREEVFDYIDNLLGE